jgi:sterol desaturase/sphingolipid hydroxylase (fatty acid hydroxylase superfamily)
MKQWLMAHGESLQYVVFATLLALMIALERARPARRQVAPRGARWRSNYALTALNVVAMGALPLSFVGAAGWAESRGLGLLHMAALPALLVVPANLLGRGFISWITHLLMHKVPLFWRVHRVHHTDTELDVSTTVRFHPLEFPVGLVVGLPLVLVLGLSPWLLLAYEVLDVAVTIFSHANVELPRWLERPLRYVIVTPGLHRVHHSARCEETDSNFAAVFPIWDVVFGTFRTVTAEPALDMPLGLHEARDARVRSVPWLLAVPFLGSLARSRARSAAAGQTSQPA